MLKIKTCSFKRISLYIKTIYSGLNYYVWKYYKLDFRILYSKRIVINKRYIIKLHMAYLIKKLRLIRTFEAMN